MNKDKDIENIADYFADFILDELEDDILFENNDEDQYDLEDIDEELLFDVLDQIASIEQQIEIEPSKELKFNIRKERSPGLINTIQRLIRDEYWSDPPMDLSKRPPICIQCESDNCTHILNFDFSKGTNIIEIAQSKCQHITEDDYIGTCIDCIKEASVELKNRVIDKNILHLWDTIDMANFYRMKIENELEYGLLN